MKPRWRSGSSRPLLNAGDDKLTVRSIKVQADGALGSRTAWLHAPYSDAPHTSGVLTYDLEALAALIERSRPDGWQINVHAIGDRANSEVLESLPRSPKHLPITVFALNTPST